MTTAQLEQALLVFVNDTLLGGKARVTPTDRLFEDGFVDSLCVLELIAFLESATGPFTFKAICATCSHPALC